MLRERRSIASSMRCTVDIALATTRIGSTLRPVQKAAWVRKSFEYGTWRGEIRSGLQLNKHGIDQLIVIGLIAHT